MTAIRKKNGKIELLRFLFAIDIILFHINLDVFNNHHVLFQIGSFNVTLSQHGNMGVEFFFLVSGFLMAKSLSKRNGANPSTSELGLETVRFIWHKMKAILPYSIPFCIIMLGAQSQMLGGDFGVKYVLDRIPDFFFMQRVGITDKNILIVDWYISSMLIAMAVLYPVLRKQYRLYVCLIGPFLALLIVGFMIHETGQLGGSLEWFGFTYKTNFRAIAEISLGASAYEVCTWLQQKNLSTGQRAALSAAEIGAYGLTFAYLFSDLPFRYDFYALALLCIAVTISFSQQSLFARSRLFENKLCDFLGTLSLPTFLVQYIFIKTVLFYAPELRLSMKCIVIVGGAVAAAIIAHVIKTQCGKAWSNRKKAQ